MALRGGSIRSGLVKFEWGDQQSKCIEGFSILAANKGSLPTACFNGAKVVGCDLVLVLGTLEEGQDSTQELLGAAVGHSKLGTAHKHTTASIGYRWVYH